MGRFFRLSRSGVRLVYKIRHHKGHGIHSPFVFHLINRVIEEKAPYYGYETIDRHLHSLIEPKLHLKKYNLLSFRLVNYFNAKKILQIGAGKGVNPICLTAPASDIRCVVIAKSAKEREVCKKLFTNWGRNIQILPDLPLIEEKQDAIIIDLENFEYPSDYLHRCLRPSINQNSFVLVDGIRKNKKNHKIWREFSEIPERTAKLDLYHHGILFFDKRLSRYDYQISF